MFINIKKIANQPLKFLANLANKISQFLFITVTTLPVSLISAIPLLKAHQGLMCLRIRPEDPPKDYIRRSHGFISRQYFNAQYLVILPIYIIFIFVGSIFIASTPDLATNPMFWKSFSISLYSTHVAAHSIAAFIGNDYFICYFEQISYRVKKYILRDINVRNHCGDSLLHLAIMRRDLKAIHSLLKHNDIDFSAKNKENDTVFDLTLFEVPEVKKVFFDIFKKEILTEKILPYLPVKNVANLVVEYIDVENLISDQKEIETALDPMNNEPLTSDRNVSLTFRQQSVHRQNETLLSRAIHQEEDDELNENSSTTHFYERRLSHQV